MAYNRYQYETSPRKLKPEYETIKKRYPKKSTARKTNQKVNIKNKKADQAKVLLYVALGFTALFVISYRYSIIDKTYADLTKTKAELELVKKENAQLEANIESSLNLSKIEQDARELLGMQKLSAEQKVYVTLPKKDYVETSSEEIKDINKSPNWFMQIIDKIINTLK